MKVVLAISIVAVSCAGMASAAAINTSGPGGGVLNIGGLSVDVTGTEAAGCIDFYNLASPATSYNPTPCGSNSGSFTVDSPSDQSLFSAPNTTGNPIKDVPGMSTPLVGFMVQNGITFDLLSITQGGTNFCSAGDNPPSSYPTSCTLPNSPFIFTIGPDATHISVSFSAELCAYTGSSGTDCSNGTLYTGTFTSEFAGSYITDAAGDKNTVSLGNLISQEESSFGITDAVSANLTPSAVPEPGTSFLLGSGLIGVGMLARRRSRRRNA